jgi:hypothetical protein
MTGGTALSRPLLGRAVGPVASANARVRARGPFAGPDRREAARFEFLFLFFLFQLNE